MTFKNERYKGAPDGQFKILLDDENNTCEILAGKEYPSDTFIASLVGYFIYNKGAQNLFADAAINAALVEKQQEEIERLRFELKEVNARIEGLEK